MKTTVAYLPIESYRSRYSELMSCKGGWAEKRLSSELNLVRIEPEEGQESVVIQNGSVLDRIQRPLWALEQVKQTLLKYPYGKIFFEDMFHPGIEALFYSGRNYEFFTYCWAQSFDTHDFTRPLSHWMRPYELMLLNAGVTCFVASPILQDLILTSIPGLSPEQIPVVGLPFNSADVAGHFDPTFCDGQEFDVVFSSRFDIEKNPGFLLSIIERLPHLQFVICTGHDELRGTDRKALARAQALADKQGGNLTILTGLSKREYYAVLRRSKVQFNTASQDWVSFTLLEALTHGCLPVYPMYRDFAHVFALTFEALYSPGNYDSACERIDSTVKLSNDKEMRKALLTEYRTNILAYHDGTYDRIAAKILGE